MQDEELAYGLRSVAGPVAVPDGRVVAGVNLAVQARDWSTQRIVRELQPAAARDLRRDLGRSAPGPADGRGPRRASARQAAPEALDDDQRAVYDADRRRPARRRDRSCSGSSTTRAGSRARSTPSCCSPGWAWPLQAVGSAVRYETTLSDRAREIAILVVAAHWRLGLRVVRPRGGRAARRADRRRARGRPGRPLRRAAGRRAAGRPTDPRAARRGRPRRRRATPRPSTPSACRGCSSCSPWSATTPRSPCSCASSGSRTRADRRGLTLLRATCR